MINYNLEFYKYLLSNFISYFINTNIRVFIYIITVHDIISLFLGLTF